MNLQDFITRIIDDGIVAAKERYSHPNHKLKLDGSIKGFEACRGKTVVQLVRLLDMANLATKDSRENRLPNHRWYRYYQLQVKWVCVCVSVVLVNEDLIPITCPTRLGFDKTVELIGPKKDEEYCDDFF